MLALYFALFFIVLVCYNCSTVDRLNEKLDDLNRLVSAQMCFRLFMFMSVTESRYLHIVMQSFDIWKDA